MLTLALVELKTAHQGEQMQVEGVSAYGVHCDQAGGKLLLCMEQQLLLLLRRHRWRSSAIIWMQPGHMQSAKGCFTVTLLLHAWLTSVLADEPHAEPRQALCSCILKLVESKILLAVQYRTAYPAVDRVTHNSKSSSSNSSSRPTAAVSALVMPHARKQLGPSGRGS
jgi:hypothetical protein